MESSDDDLLTGKCRTKQVLKESILGKYFHPVEIFIYENMTYFNEDLKTMFQNSDKEEAK
jgi:hypothetical protein